MAANDEESDKLDIFTDRESPKRSDFILHQCLGWLVYVLLTTLVLILSLLYVVCMCFIVLPIAVVTCKYREVPSFYVAPVRLQAEIFRKYRYIYHNRKAEWDLEMSKPQPLPHPRRRALSAYSAAKDQEGSNLLNRLPAEIRLEIYKYLFTSDRKIVNIQVHLIKNPHSRHLASRIEGSPSSPTSDSTPVKNCNCRELKFPARSLPYCPVVNEDRGRGILALPRTCRQVYMETIDVLYSHQTFYFSTLNQPPYFLDSIIPERMAQIRHIQLCYNQKMMSKACQSNTTRSSRHQHDFQRCASCNVNLWLDTIRKKMPNLATIQVFLYLDKSLRIPSINDPWILKVFKLQVGPNGLRELKIDVISGLEEDRLGLPWFQNPLHPFIHDISADRLRTRLQETIRKGAEAQAQKDRAVVATQETQVSTNSERS